MPGKTLFEKIWQRHVVVARDDGQTLLYIDRHLAHDGSFNGFNQLRKQGLSVRRPDQTFAITTRRHTPRTWMKSLTPGHAK